MPAATEPAPSAAILRSRARRDQILSAAAKLFGENGFHGSSMAELAKRAGMSVGHIYHYFQNKDAIIEALVDREMEELSGLLDEVYPSGDVLTTLMDRLDAIVDRRLDRDTLPLALEVLAEAARNPRIAEKLHTADAASRHRLAHVVSVRLAGLGEREVADRVEAISATFYGLIYRTVHNPCLDRDAVVRTTHLVLRQLLTNDSTA
ncbi:MAG TPA: TetR family transcriptional regulator [Mycobacterium sp.]|nr:TetR family transcriptional regulator [Mycobacterium sp.]